MLRVLFFFLVLIVLAFGEAWLVDQPGKIMLTWQGYRIETSILVGLGAIAVSIAAAMLIWSGIRVCLAPAAHCLRG